jgi:hypothetical protein
MDLESLKIFVEASKMIKANPFNATLAYMINAALYPGGLTLEDEYAQFLMGRFEATGQ